jgi:hypothetical protein
VEGRRPWFLAAAALGLVGVAVSGAVAASRPAGDRADAYRAGGASTLLIVGLVVAIGLGATAVQRDAASGWLGLLVGAGARRGRLAVARALGRVALLLATVAVWGVALQVGSAALGRGLDGPLAVHTCAMAENLTLALLAAAALAPIFGPIVCGVFALVVVAASQAFVNLKAAADQSVIGAVTKPAVNAGYYLLPRAVGSPMIVALQARGEAGPAAPRLEVNGALVHVPAADVATVVWTLLWCGLFLAVLVAGLRRRAL